MKSFDIYGDWAKYHNSIVLVDGIKHRIQVSIHQAKYPRPAKMISVQAVPTNKNSRYYQETRRRLGDDWTTDVLDSDLELTANILQQCIDQWVPCSKC